MIYCNIIDRFEVCRRKRCCVKEVVTWSWWQKNWQKHWFNFVPIFINILIIQASHSLWISKSSFLERKFFSFSKENIESSKTLNSKAHVLSAEHPKTNRTRLCLKIAWLGNWQSAGADDFVSTLCKHMNMRVFIEIGS